MPAAQEAYLFDRIAMYEGRSQRYGTQSLLCPDGKYRRWQTENPEALNQRRVSMGLPPVPDDPPESEPTDESRAQYEHWARGYTQWLQETDGGPEAGFQEPRPPMINSRPDCRRLAV